MYYDVIKLKYIKDYILYVEFENGKKGRIDLKKYSKKSGIFRELADISFFKKASINKELGVITWPNGLDIAPENIYHQATGEPLPAWMELSFDE